MRARALFVVSLVLVAATLVPPSPSSWASTPSGSVLHGVTAVSTTDIWAAGYVVSNGVSRGLMERWNGSSWKIVPTPTSGTSNAFLNELAVIGSNDVWVVGDRNNTKVLEGANGKTLAEHWNGIAWNIVPTPNPGSGANILRGAMAVSSNNVWAAGYYKDGTINKTLIEHWDGSSWTVVPSPNGTGADGNYLSGLAGTSENDIWAAGAYTIHGVYQTLILHWDGTGWSIVPTPSPGVGTSYPQGALLRTVNAVAVGDAWSVGRYWNGSRFLNLALHWDGNTWSQVTTPNVGTSDNELRGVGSSSSANVWAVGYDHGATYRTLTERWTGSGWSIVPSPNVGSYSSYVKGVAVLAASDAWTTGYYVKSGNYRTLIEHWNGSSWRIVSSPNA